MANNYTPTSIPPVGPPPPKKGSKYVPPELSRIPDALAEGGGVWRSCSGCHCLNEGVPTGDWSEVMRCHLGIGCRECGGIGAIWDMTDYADMAAFMNQPPHEHTTGLIEAAKGVIASASDTYKKRNGHLGSFEDDSGEKCWIVPFDAFEALRSALATTEGQP